MKLQKTRLLILCKTYPSPSAKYTETSCVAAMTEAGDLIRIYPVPFRLIESEHQFKKWQWITAKIEKATNDNRPESYRIDVSTIKPEGTLPTAEYWSHRRHWLNKLMLYEDFNAVERARVEHNATLALLKPGGLDRLEIQPAKNPDWTKEEKAKLLREQLQGNLFQEENERRGLNSLRKLPYDFYYHYWCDTASGEHIHRHKIVDWEAGALYWKVAAKPDWENLFRNRYEQEFAHLDLRFLMGTIHRFPNQWLIIGVIYPPRLPPELLAQGSLF